MRFAFTTSLIVATLSASGAVRAGTVQIDNQRGEKVKICTYRSDDKRLVRPRQCWMIKPGRKLQWRRGEDDSAFDVRLFEPGAFELPICLKRNIRDSYKIEIAQRGSKVCVQPFARQTVAVQQWQPLDRVLVNWSGDRFWYPATILQSGEDRYRVRFDDGRVVETESRYIARLSIAPGARVEVDWKGQGRWYAGRVQSSDTDTANVRFDDGFDETSPLHRLRFESAATTATN